MDARTSRVTPPIHPRMPWRVVEVQPLADFRLRVRFVEGIEGMVNMIAFVHKGFC